MSLLHLAEIAVCAVLGLVFLCALRSGARADEQMSELFDDYLKERSK